MVTESAEILHKISSTDAVLCDKIFWKNMDVTTSCGVSGNMLTYSALSSLLCYQLHWKRFFLLSKHWWSRSRSTHGMNLRFTFELALYCATFAWKYFMEITVAAAQQHSRVAFHFKRCTPFVHCIMRLFDSNKLTVKKADWGQRQLFWLLIFLTWSFLWLNIWPFSHILHACWMCIN